MCPINTEVVHNILYFGSTELQKPHTKTTKYLGQNTKE